MTYKTRLNKMIAKSGRKRIWLSRQLKMTRTTFWRRVQKDELTNEEKQRIETLLEVNNL